MILLRRLVWGFRTLIRKRRAEQELDEELRAYIDAVVEQKMAGGMSPADARRAVRLESGSLEAAKDRVREVGWESGLESVWQDVRYAVRMLRRSPGFTAVAVLTLALGIGANTAIFTIVHAYLLKEPPVRNPDALVTFRWSGENNVRQMSSEYAYIAGRENPAAAPTGLTVGGTFSFDFFEQLRVSNLTLSHVAAVAPTGSLSVGASGRAEPANGQFVSGSFFSTLGVFAALGRAIEPSDDAESAEPVAVLSDQYWARRFARDPSILGKSVTINGVEFTVIGVASSSVRDLARRGFPDSPDVLIPLTFEPRVRISGSLLHNPAAWWLMVIGRMVSGVNPPQVQASVAPLLARTVVKYLGSVPPEQQRRARVPRLHVVSARYGLSDPAPDVLNRFAILAAICGIVLLIVCVNISNLLLSRTVVRGREIAVRTAIGATGARMVRQLLTEAAVLGGAGGVIALLAAAASISLLADVLLQPASLTPTVFNVSVVSFVVVLTVLVVAVFGIVPSLRGSRAHLAAPATRELAGSLSSSRLWLSKSLLITQIALSLPLLVGAGLFVRTLTNLRAVDVGFNPEHIVLFTLEPELSGYDRPRAAALYQEIKDHLLRVPGVEAVSSSALTSTLMDGGTIVMFLDGDVRANMLSVEHDFFATLGVPLRRGRTFTLRDTPTSTPVAVVNETLARRLFPDADPIGRQLRAGSRQLEIVGIVRDVKVNGLREAMPPTFYRSVDQLAVPSRRVIVRTAGNATAQIPAIRDAMRAIDPHLPLLDVSTQLDRIESKYLTNERMFAVVSSAVGGLALVVTMVGLFGLMSYTVARRTKELGIRMALGAERGHVLRSVMGETMWLAGVGIVIGVGAALGVSRFVDSLMFGLGPQDPATLSAAAALMLAVAVLAVYLPARRATRIDPLVALRYE